MITEVFMPALGETLDEARLVRWIKREGDPVKKGEPIFEIETDKATLEVEALAGGVVRQILQREGTTVPVGSVVAYLASAMTESIPGTPLSALPADSDAPRREDQVEGPGVRQTVPTQAAPARAGRLVLSPRARRLADQQALDPTALAGLGTGPSGRIVEADVRRFLNERRQAPWPTPSAPEAPPHTDTIVPLAGIRKTIAERTSRSAQTAPHLTLEADIDMSGAEAWRTRANALREAQGQPAISLTALIVKVCGWALQRHPWMNATLANDRITLHGQVNIGVAVALAEGLIVPVVHDTPGKGTAAIAAEVEALSQKARGNRLRANDLTGGTFTVSNLGMFGVDRFTAILNPPEAGILAVGRIVKRLVPGENEVPVARPMMTVTLSADHRMVDGAVAARFLADVRAGLEDPGRLIL